jgi:hypothetical protein
LPLNDYGKREAIKKQLGFDVTAAIENSGDEDGNSMETPSAKRRVAVKEEETVRRVVVKTDK